MLDLIRQFSMSAAPAGTDERELHIGAVGPGVEHLTFELRAVIQRNRSRQVTRVAKRCRTVEELRFRYSRIYKTLWRRSPLRLAPLPVGSGNDESHQ